jgi:hypothetical protein
MNYKVTISPDAIARYQDIPYFDRSQFREFVHFRLSNNPELRDEYAIKGLLGLRGLKCSLTTGQAHVFYDVIGFSVEILLIVLALVPTETGPVIKKQGVPVGTIQTVTQPKLSESEFQEKVDASRQRIRSGEGVLFEDLPL